ncbi:MAG: site-specific integrase [Litoreibacter sp.]
MLVMIELKYVNPDKKSGILKYRRRIPKALQLALGKTEFVVSFKTDNHELALRMYDQVHRNVEIELNAAREKSPEAIAYQATLKDLQKHSLIENGATKVTAYSTETNEPTDIKAARVLHELAVSKGTKSNPDNWDDSGEFERIVAAKFGGLEKPRITLREAQRIYIKAKRRKPTVARIDGDTKRVVSYLCDLMNKEDPFLWEIDREVTRQFRDKMLNEGSSPATVMRRISSIKPIIQHIIREQLEDGLRNHFAELPVEELREENEKEKREALTVLEITKVIDKLGTKNRELQDLWVLLTFTGARGNEICGLAWDDVKLDHETPHILIRPNSIRGTKNNTKRGIPLIGAALKTLTVRAGGHRQDEPVFPSYSRSRGADAASTMLVKIMKQADVWVKTRKVPYSLRHAHKDWMTRVAPRDICGRMHDHSGGSIEANYGSDDLLDILNG